MSKIIHFWVGGWGVACYIERAANQWTATTILKKVTCKRCIVTFLYRNYKRAEESNPEIEDVLKSLERNES